ncbi:hypothetical protein Ae263Ps1_2285 [Pseudonocardia sp. Ae263_Ps1]|nr:hypothetical protein Ae263Ps1_2285 [Pseudonocardia sp. Ae263_Ps1]OLL94745.1 hypothetical protein Ae356Ps1_4642c [Pseudonocardia sp. Ae356_Ps1]
MVHRLRRGGDGGGGGAGGGGAHGTSGVGSASASMSADMRYRSAKLRVVTPYG